MITTCHSSHANDENLSSLGRRKKGEIQEATITVIVADDNNHTGLNASQTVQTVTRATLFKIGKVPNYKEQIIEAPNECDGGLTCQSLLIPEILDLLPIFDEYVTIDENSTNIDTNTKNIIHTITRKMHKNSN